MTAVTLELPDKLARQLKDNRSAAADIIQSGLLAVQIPDPGAYRGYTDLLIFLASLPEPEDVVALRPSAELQARVSELLERNRDAGLTPEECAEMDRYSFLEHLVRLAKAKALARLRRQ